MSNLVAVQFNHQTLTATLLNGIPHVALKPICNQLDLDWSAQVQKIKRHPVLNQVMVMITTTTIGKDGKSYMKEMLMLPLSYLNGWLFGIDSNRVKPEAKEAVLKYQRECFNVLANHFMPKPYGLKDLPPDMTLVKKSFINDMEDELTRLIQIQNAPIAETRLTHEQWLHFMREEKGYIVVNLKTDELLDLVCEQGFDVINLQTHKPVAKSVLNVIQDLLDI
jgi:hypothetical protein